MSRKISLPLLDAQIAKAEIRVAKEQAELSRLKTLRRPLVAGLASGQARERKHAERDARIWAQHDANSRHHAVHTSLYGSVITLAEKFQVSTRQIHRILKRQRHEHVDEM